VSLRLIDRISVAGSGVNEDRAAAVGNYAWVVDGATDVIDSPLTRAATDADWIAGQIDATLRAYAAMPSCPFADLPEHLATTLAEAFAAETRHAPRGRQEHPSAAGLIIKYDAGVLSYIAISDCTMIVSEAGESDIRRCGVSGEDAGDRKLKETVVAHQQGEPQNFREPVSADNDPATLLDRMRPTLQAMRAHMNRDDGYGVLSITPTPEIFIRTGFMSVDPGTRILLASDGFMRLVDVFARYDANSLFAASASRGLAPLIDELRSIEVADATASAHPRVKARDDATALLLEVTA
jgi:hypothetical protein